MLRDVYCAADVPNSLELRAQTAALVMPAHAVLINHTAAWLWSVDALRPDKREQIPKLEVFMLPGHKRVLRRKTAGGERALLTRDVVELLSVHVTTPVRTALDLACQRKRYEALAAMDALAHCQKITMPKLVSELPHFRDRQNVVQARRLIPLMNARTESSKKSFTRLAIIKAKLPHPCPQHWIEETGTRIFRLDLAYPDLKICVEYDKQKHHTSPADRAADQSRHEWLEDQDWIVIVVDKNSFRNGALDS